MVTPEDVSVLLVMGSPRRDGNTRVLVDKAREGLLRVGKFRIDEFSIAGARVEPCNECQACSRIRRCIFDDSFQAFFDKWMRSDAVLIAVPVFHMGVPGQLKALIDRLGHVSFAVNNRSLPRFTKVGAAIAQGSSRYGGQELAIQYLAMHFLLMNCLVVSGDTPGSYVGGAGFASTWEPGSIRQDPDSLAVASNLGQRLGEAALIVKSGLECLGESLPVEYRPASTIDR